MKQKFFNTIMDDGEVVVSSGKRCGKEIQDRQQRYLSMEKHALQCPVYTQEVNYSVLSESSALRKERGLYHSNTASCWKRKGSFSADSLQKKRRMKERAERAKALTSALLELFVEQVLSFPAWTPLQLDPMLL